MHFFKNNSKIILSTLLLLSPMAASASIAVFSTAGGPTFDLDYASSGFATVTARYLGPFGNETPDVVNASVTGLSFESSISGEGTGLFQIDYRVHNTSASDSFNLGFIARVDPDGAGLFTEDSGNATFSSNAIGEAVSWEIDSNSGNLDAHLNGGSLDNTNNCASGCDLVYALQWNLGTLNPGQVAIIRLGLSDDGQTLSNNFLDASSTTSAATLRLSGLATVVPLPAALPLFISALMGLGFISRRKV
jgi:hypothetical protein